ncbi:MAG: hypothetical protein CMJ49_00505 [Planctomycetaceae bacterium]|nr:hypothetical protein [Planctomycetaceae bacterium]
MTQLEQFIQDTAIVNTHEHLVKEDAWTAAGQAQTGPDIVSELFSGYLSSDLLTAGATPEAVEAATTPTGIDIAKRFEGIREAWEMSQLTGYGEAARITAKLVYGMDRITGDALEAAQDVSKANRVPGRRHSLLSETGNIDHVQIDDFVRPCEPDPSGLDFFLYDLSWVSFCQGAVEVPEILEQVGVEVKDVATYREAVTAIFQRWGPTAIAVKTQHAYGRTLRWTEQTDADAAKVLAKVLAEKPVSQDELDCLGDWGFARGIEQAMQHNLPIKIHTGYYAGNRSMIVDRIRPGHLAPLLIKYPDAKFVLMHIGYPYEDEIIALAKHFPNVYVDMCWAWSIDPYASCRFVRKMIHAAPINRLFGFGGDTFCPSASVGYAMQARAWLNRALQAEIDQGLLSEDQAIQLAERFMRANQLSCFDLNGTRAAIHAAAAAPA